MRNKEMSMNDYRVMYAEYCLGAGASYATMAMARGFTKFVAWRKKERLLEREPPVRACATVSLSQAHHQEHFGGVTLRQHPPEWLGLRVTADGPPPIRLKERT